MNWYLNAAPALHPGVQAGHGYPLVVESLEKSSGPGVFFVGRFFTWKFFNRTIQILYFLEWLFGMLYFSNSMSTLSKFQMHWHQALQCLLSVSFDQWRYNYTDIPFTSRLVEVFSFFFVISLIKGLSILLSILSLTYFLFLLSSCSISWQETCIKNLPFKLLLDYLNLVVTPSWWRKPVITVNSPSLLA